MACEGVNESIVAREDFAHKAMAMITDTTHRKYGMQYYVPATIRSHDPQ